MTYNCYGNDCSYWQTLPPKKTKIPANGVKISRPDYYDCYYYHYSNPKSQNALIRGRDFPDFYIQGKENYSVAYSDRICGWDWKHYNEIIKKFGVSGEQAWGQNLQKLSEKEFKAFCGEMLKIEKPIKHARAIHWYNVSNGYSCPTLEVIY